MKFNEKLIELRKKHALSQEELGYKLKVTRQTVSKWELGQTTPEMEKLAEISKIFNISVDQLINESEVISNADTVIEDKKIGDQVIEEKSDRTHKVFVIIVITLIVVIVSIIIKMFTAFNIFNKVTQGSENITGKSESFFGRIFNLLDKAIDSQENILENIGNAENEINKTRFNNTLKLYQGSNTGFSLKRLLDEVITINKTEEGKVSVKYNEKETHDSEEIKNLKTSFEDSKNFEISFDYDEEGYINKVTIEKVISKFEVNSFNNSLEIYAGTNMGVSVIYVLDDIVTSNKKEERKITIKYNEIETQDETEIKNVKRNIRSFDNYEITFEYDVNGFINKAII